MLSDKQINAFDQDGYLILEDWVSDTECEALKNRMEKIIDNFSDEDLNRKSIFSTTSKDHQSDQYFLESADKVRLFYEKEAFSLDGTLAFPLGRAINKVGHALHQLDPVFKNFSLQEKMQNLCRDLASHSNPYCIQSMYIFKQPKIGGEVVCHQDSTYIHSKSGRLLGMWVALEDADRENGCLWGIPGKYFGEPKAKLIREGSKLSMRYDDKLPFDEANLVPIEVKKGSMLVFNGLFPHLSHENRSEYSRHAYTMHWIDGRGDLSPESWIAINL